MQVKVLLTQLCLTLWNPMVCSLPGSSVHGILQARVLEWVTIPSSRESFRLGLLHCRQIDSLTSEPPGKPSKMVGGTKSHLESNPKPTRDTQRAQTNLGYTKTQRTHRDWARTVSECLLQRYQSAVACCRGRNSGCSRSGHGISPLGGGRH